jgi:surface antigen
LSPKEDSNFGLPFQLNTGKMHSKFKRKIVRRGLVYANILLILVVGFIVWYGQDKSIHMNNSSLWSQASQQSEVPLDRISSADIASNIAKVVSLPEAVAVSNQADSVNAQLASAQTDQAIIAKPQVVAGSAKNRKDVQKYITKDGDTISSIAAAFGITSDSVRWSNDLYGDRVAVGKELSIPPIEGIVYKVLSSDTIDSISKKYQADKTQLISFNDIELSGLPVGELIVIPNGRQYVAPSTTVYYGFSPEYGGNGYTYGYCTYYVATRVSVPRNWGNANTWAYYARLSGWTVSSVPVPGAIAQSPYMSYWGHVAYVEEVSPDGTMMKYSDMNALAGWNRVGYSDWVKSSFYPNYIYH